MTLPHWDLTNVYPSLESKEFKQAVDKLKNDLNAMDRYLAASGIVVKKKGGGRKPPFATTVNGFLSRLNELMTLNGTLTRYVSSFTSTDSFNATAKRIESELDMLEVRLQKQGLAFRIWLGRNAKQLPKALKGKGAAKDHAFFLHEVVRQSKYLMSDKEETLAADLSLSGANAWSKLQGVVTSQLTVDFERDGKTVKLPMTALINLKYDPDPQIRERSYHTEHAAWDIVREPLAAAMNGVKGEVATLNKRRGRKDDVHPSLDQARIDRETLEAMMGAMRDSFPMFRSYLKAKAKKLGKDKLPWWDMFAPMGKTDRVYSYDEARELVLTQFGAFSGNLRQLAQRAFDNHWIDAEPRKGKRGGAFCMGVPAVKESRILCNFDGSLDQVSTIAHELGHAFHNECFYQHNKKPLQRTTPMTLAETASTFCETIITEAALKTVSSAAEQLAILDTSIGGANQIVVDISSRFLFEKEVFEHRANAELSADDLCEIMLRSQQETYGDGLDGRYLHKYMWTWKPHYYITDLSFYNYPYAFGLLFGTGLYAIYQQRGADFVPQYESLLASTGEADAATLAKRFGINIRDKKFWQDSLNVIGKQIERFKSLE